MIRISLYNERGVLVAHGLHDIVDLDLARAENQAGAFTITLPGLYLDLGIGPDWIIEVHRQVGENWVLDGDTCWFVRRIEEYTDPEQGLLVVLSGHDTTGLLARRIVAWFGEDNPPEGFDGMGYKTQPADDMIRLIFNENFGPGVNTPGAPPSVTDPLEIPPDPVRDYNSSSRIMLRPPWPPIGEQSLLGQARVVSHDIAWRNCLEVFREISESSAQEGQNIIFDIVYRSNDLSGIGAFDFRVWMNQRGKAHENLVFGEEQGTLNNARFVRDWTEEATWVHVGGPGQGDLRLVVGALDPGATDQSPFYPIETFVDSGETSENVDSLVMDAAVELYRRRGKYTLTGELIQTPESYFGVHYEYGDSVVVRHRDVEFTARISSYRLLFNRDGLEITIPITANKIIREGIRDVLVAEAAGW